MTEPLEPSQCVQTEDAARDMPPDAAAEPIQIDIVTKGIISIQQSEQKPAIQAQSQRNKAEGLRKRAFTAPLRPNPNLPQIGITSIQEFKTWVMTTSTDMSYIQSLYQE